MTTKVKKKSFTTIPDQYLSFATFPVFSLVHTFKSLNLCLKKLNLRAINSALLVINLLEINGGGGGGGAQSKNKQYKKSV
jgi:hypothetical protein